jgi:hypothetical protein
MEYFSTFPYILYPDLSNTQENVFVQDITIRVILNELGVNTKTLFYNYTIYDGDTPEILAEKFYKNYNYHWVILIVNHIFDVQLDWPLTTLEFNEYITKKYGSVVSAMQEKIYIIYPYENKEHPYIVPYLTYVNYTPENRKMISAYDYELEENNKKRHIRILKPEYVEKFVSLFNAQINKDGN